MEKEFAGTVHGSITKSIRLPLSLVGERNLVAGNASGEEFFLASLVGEDLAGKI